jgi:predicted ATPase
VILRRLSVFVGAFSLEAAQFVAAGNILEREQVAEAIAGLVTKSLIVVETNHAGALYRLLDTTRAYVLTKMVDSGETQSRNGMQPTIANSRSVLRLPPLLAPKTMAPPNAGGM